MTEELKKTQLSDTLNIKDYFEPHEFTWGQKVVKRKGRPMFFWREELSGYVDSTTLLRYNKEHGLRKKKEPGYKPPKPYEPRGNKKKRGEILTKTVGNINKRRKKKKASSDADHYPTPPACTQALIDFLSLPKDTKIWEPACGAGHISQTLKLNGYGKVISSDLYNYSYGHSGVDFLKHDNKDYEWIVTNPPFNLAEEFIVRAWKNRKPFAFLLKAIYWNSVRRRDLFMLTKPTHVLPLTWRPDFSFQNKSSTMDCSWVIWGPDSFKNLDFESEDFLTEYFPLKRPDNYPDMDITGQLQKPFHPFYKDREVN